MGVGPGSESGWVDLWGWLVRLAGWITRPVAGWVAGWGGSAAGGAGGVIWFGAAYVRNCTLATTPLV